MPTLLELTQQGDPGTAPEGRLAELTLLTPCELYFLWERQQWAAGDVDFSMDREHWQSLSPDERTLLRYDLSSFFVAEERVATAFSPIVMSAEDEQEEAFLATQQVDEVRHMQFFDRFWSEVVDGEGQTTRERLASGRRNCNESFRELFDRRLMDAVTKLRHDPADTAAKVAAITIYHMVAEGTLALTGQHYIIDYLEKQQLLPGFVEGFQNVARDEHRHVAYGTWFLQQKCTTDERYTEVVHETLLELLPVAAGVLVPPGYEADQEFELVGGYTSSEINEFAFRALNRRLSVIGIGLPVGV